MFDFVRDLRKSAAEKRQERLNAYVDGELSPQQMQAFEQELTQDADLRAELDMHQTMKVQLSQLPRRRVPRNFTLDPAKYGRPAPQPLFQLYPVMRVATVLTAVIFVLAIGLGTFVSPQIAGTFAPVASNLESASEAEAVSIADGVTDEQMVEVTRVVVETVVEEGEAIEVTRIATDIVAEPAEDDVAGEPADEPAMEAPAEEEMAEAAPAAEPPADGDMAVTADTGGNAGSVAPTPTVQPTATQSELPRPEPTTEIARRATAVATIVSPPAVNQSEPTYESPVVRSNQSTDGWGVIIIISLILFIILLSLTLYVRRQLM